MNLSTPRLALAASGLAALHVAVVAFVDSLPEAWAPALATTVYLPLWPLSAVGLPVFGPAPSGGWPGPSGLGWGLLFLTWAAAWSIPMLAVAKLWPRRRPLPHDR
jgi:hypothetical protein